MRTTHFAAGLFALAAPAFGQVEANPYNFAAVTQLAQGALVGTGVTTPVPGFDLLFMKDGRVVYHRSFGNWSLNRVANADSATKTIAGAVIMSVVDSSQQPFTLNSTLSQFLPGYNNEKAGITIRQCFSHSAGFGNSLAISSQFLSLQQAAFSISDDQLDFAPGSTFSYGGTSMHVAGAAAEVAGGQPWNTLFVQRIANPIGMPNTRFVLTTPTNPRIAGGCESTASEFSRFMEMLRKGGVHNGTQILSRASVDAMFTRQTALNIPVANSPLQADTAVEQSDYGVGVWLDDRLPNGLLVGAIAAGARGFASWIDFDDGMVGTFATDVSSSANLQPLFNQIRVAAQAAVRAAAGCPGDTAGPGQSPFADGTLTADDIIVYLNWYFAGDRQADRAGPGQSPNPDGQLTADDIIVYLNAYFAGC